MVPILLIFVLSGAASLIYEVVWMRHLTLIFGVSTYATSTVLAAFMGGLALGSLLLGRWADRLRRPLLVYAGLEFAIGIYALAIPTLLEALRGPYVALYQLGLPYTGLALGRAALAALVLLPPTVLMGGTLPVLAAFFVRRRDGDVGRQTGILYFANTGGAVLGCALAGFHLIEHFGLVATTQVAAATNFVLAAATVGLHRLRGGDSGPAPAPAEHRDDARPHQISAATARVAVWAVGLSGLTALAYEVFWTRALLRYVYNSTYAFTTMLAVFLAGLAIGSWLQTVLPYRRSRPALVFAALELGVGLGFLVSLLLFVDLRGVSALLLGDVTHTFAESLQTMVLRAALILFVPSVFLGATLPLATHMVASPNAVGSSVGRVYGVNTIGAIVGSLAASFVLIPGLGMQNTLLLLVATNVVLAIALAAIDLGRVGRAVVAGGGVALLASIAPAMPDDAFRGTFVGPRGGQLIYYHEGATDSIGVVERDGQRRIMYEDQRGTAATWSYPVGYVFGHLPVLLHPGHPKTALHICFGAGNSLSAIAAHESIVEIDNVELSPQILHAADYFWTNDGVIHSPKVRTVIDDGRNFVMATAKTYDVIELEPPEVFTAGVINLYTREFYTDLERRLADDGVAVQWIPIGQASLDEERMLFRAFHDVFPHATAWQQLARDGNILLVGTKAPLRIDYALLAEKMRAPRIRRDLELASVRDPIDVLSMFIFGSDAFAAFVRDAEPVVDDRTVLDFSIPRQLGSGFGMGFFVSDVQQDGRRPLTAILERARDYHRARRSVVPYVTNYGGESAAAFNHRILARRRPTTREVLIPIPESEWNRWPDEPSTRRE